jgi:hypothetical protein
MYDALIKVSTGFKLVYYGLVLIVLAVVVGMVGAFALGAGAAAGGGGRGAVAAAGGLGLLVGGMAVTGSVVGLIGRFMCLAVPDRAGGAKSKIVVSVALEVVSLLISLANLADDLGGNFLPAEFKMVGSGGGLICSIIAAILFLLFARDLALYIRRSKLADDAMSVLRLWVAAVGCYIAGFGILLVGAWGAGPGAAGGGAAGMACAGGLLALAGLVIAIIALISYARLLIGMSDAVRKYAGKVRYGGDEDGEDGFDDEDDRPRRRRRRDDDEDEDDDRPRRRRRRDEDEDDDRWER